MSGFKQFILRGNVVDLAVAVVIGAAFGAVVQALVKDIITPIIGAIGGAPDFSVVYYFVVLPVGALMERMRPEIPPAAPATRECPECLSKVPLGARRCAFCTA